MLNRYQGNTGRVQRIDDTAAPPQREPPRTEKSAADTGRTQKETVSGAGGTRDVLAQLIPGALEQLRSLETEDVLLLLILYLMYRESGDKELLIIIGAMLLP